MGKYLRDYQLKDYSDEIKIKTSNKKLKKLKEEGYEIPSKKKIKR